MTSDSTSPKGSQISFSMDDFAKALEQHDYHFEKGQVIRGKVIQHTTDGAYVDIGGKSIAYVPLKEADLQFEPNLAEVLPLNTDWEFLITSEQNSEGQVQLSRRQLQLQAAWENLAEIAEMGHSVQVRVTGTNKGGVIGEVEGLRGFIPRSHLQEKENLSSLVGQLLTATFLEVNQENNKLVLSQRRAIAAASMNKLEVGKLVSGKVAKIQPYGVFVDFDGVSGLLHITQVSGSRVDALTTIFQYGQDIQVMILNIDEYKNRISLSTKILENYPGEILEKFDEVMATASTRVAQAQEKMAEEAQS
ncbi:S1 RNA-binding domain-containing protein [Crocosphaera sp. UHCC 0190]|uniref:S1 RNA-binding domain-containing protein n=1 Tax=Crocosphaera sp. UHCC 0190 TaxID=3110246 RepID=UPI002B206A97|nr:S1 RNA-binding domain-containing protein [Crocosphaera sp. UHCC 0190]MEA5509899.1 S1 RNA-binding domain-containing protein [Crocosphaera sp. UHCC 0190]